MSVSDQGGDPACWLDSVCPDCGAFVEDAERDQHACRLADPPTESGS